MAWLVTGAAGYLGSHLIRQPGDWVGMDSLVSGSRDRVPDGVPLEVADITDRTAVDAILAHHPIEGVVHLAALKSVPDSMSDPAAYERTNVSGTRTLVEAMSARGIRHLVLASSAAVYGPVDERLGHAIDESTALHPANPYGETKVAAERIVEEFAATAGGGCAILRIFNVAGIEVGLDPEASAGGVIFAAVEAAFADTPFDLTGSDYPTPDGTCVRDYVHVVDVARALAAAAERATGLEARTITANIGTGRGTSVLGVVDAVQRVTGRALDVERRPRRAGDIPVAVASVEAAKRELGWTPALDLDRMITGLWGSLNRV